MPNYLPLLILGAILGVISAVLIIAYATIKDKKAAIGFERNMKDKDILKRLVGYAKPYKNRFLWKGAWDCVKTAPHLAASLPAASIFASQSSQFRSSTISLRCAAS